MTQEIKFLIIISIVICLLSPEVEGKVRYHCDADSMRVMELIEKSKAGNNYGERVVSAAKSLVGLPYAGAADNDEMGTIVIRLDSLNQREFINVSIAAAKTAGLTSPTVRDFERNLEDISRKKGKDEGFASQFFYGADWIVDNVYRGNLKEMTEYLDGGSSRTKTLDYVSRHADQFPALKDSVTAEKVRLAEFGYRSHRLPHLKKQSIGNKVVKELLVPGDIIIMSALDDDFDIYDIGVVSLENGEPTLIHITKEQGVVEVDPFPLSRRFKIDGQFFYGYRWIRPTE